MNVEGKGLRGRRGGLHSVGGGEGFRDTYREGT